MAPPRLNLTVVSDVVDPTFRFMAVDWDGCILMDPSSVYAMKRLIGMKDRFDLSFACDTDHDRHGIVTRSSGLLTPNHFLAVRYLPLVTASAAMERGPAIFWLLRYFPCAITKTVRPSSIPSRN